MTVDEIRSIVCSAIAEVQTLSGRDATPPAATAKPIGDVDGFDSLCSIETTVLVESKLGVELGTQSIFLSEDGTSALTVQQISTRIQEILSKRGGAK